MALPITALSRVEFIDSITFDDNSTQTLRTNGGLIPNDRFLYGLLLEFRGRLTMPAATGPTAVQADAAAGILERVTVEGYHRIRKRQEKFYDLRGSDMIQEQLHYAPGTLISTPTTISVAANATNDIILQIVVPFVPQRVSSALAMGYLLDAPNYDALKLSIQWGDYKSVVVPGATDATWSAYASATGSPELRVHGMFALASSRFLGFVPGRIWRYFQEVTGSLPTTTATQSRLFDVPKGFGVRKVGIKTGVKATNTTAGNNVFASLTDFLTDLRFNQGLNKYIRRYLDGNVMYADMALSYNLSARRTGQNYFDFVQYGDPREILDTRTLIGGPTGTVDLYLSADVAGAANQAIMLTMEEWRETPIMR